MKPYILVLIALLAGGSLLAEAPASEAPPAKGAKELFFDPTDGAVVSASQLNPLKTSTKPRPPAKPLSNRSAAALKKADAAPPRIAPSDPKPGGGTVPAAHQTRRQVDKPSDGTTLGLSYWIELVGEDGKGQQVTDQRTFRSGEKIRLHFRSNADGNIALIQLGSSGTSSVLFPDPARGLADSRIYAGEDRILPTETAWFRFDSTPGTEKILVLFAKSEQDLDSFSVQPSMDATATQAVMKKVEAVRGQKDLILEIETENASEIGGYGVNLSGKPVVMEIQLKHQ